MHLRKQLWVSWHLDYQIILEQRGVGMEKIYFFLLPSRHDELCFMVRLIVNFRQNAEKPFLSFRERHALIIELFPLGFLPDRLRLRLNSNSNLRLCWFTVFLVVSFF
jgi:hypothetical protein